jgi:hypothetical protein
VTLDVTDGACMGSGRVLLYSDLKRMHDVSASQTTVRS